MKKLRLLCCLALLAGCGPRARPSYRIAVRVESDPGVPLAGAQLRAAGQTLARSDDKGLIAAELRGAPGDQVRLDVVCPAGYRAPSEPLSVLLRPLDELGKRPEFRAVCAPLARKLVVAVRAELGPGLPLRYLGQELARTDDQGAAHVLLDVTPGDTVSLTLDTSAPEHARLMPQHPELKLTVPERDQIVVFDQKFTRPKPKPKPIPVEPKLPQRI